MAQTPFQWSGFYFGGHVGGGWSDESWDVYGNTIGTGTMSGFLGGLQVGRDWQQGKAVIGVQGDVSFGDVNGTAGLPHAGNYGDYPGNCWSGGDQTARCGSKTDWTAALTARIGMLVLPDTLFYLKGGVAYAHDEFSVTNETPSPYCGSQSYGLSHDYAPVGQNQFGGTIGVGAEHAFSNRISMFVEGDYTDFGTQNVNFADTGYQCSPAFTAKVHQTLGEVKVGLNVHY